MRISGWGALACAAVFMVACDTRGRTNRYDDTTATTSRETTTSGSVAQRDTYENNTPTIGTSGQATGSDARRFAEQALGANVAEIKLGELAKSHAQNASVKQFAQMMVSDHTKAKNELKQAVKGNNVDEPTQLDAKHQALYDKLSRLNGAEFDRAYMSAMVDGHREVKNMLDDRAGHPATAKGTSGSTSDDSQLDAAVNRWAGKALPTVSHHLQRAEEISRQVK